MPDADLYVNVCIFVIISYAMRYPVKSILFKKPQSQQKIRNEMRQQGIHHAEKLRKNNKTA